MSNEIIGTVSTPKLKQYVLDTLKDMDMSESWHDVDYDDWCNIDGKYQVEIHYGVDKGEPFCWMVQHDLAQIALECEKFRQLERDTMYNSKTKDRAAHFIMKAGKPAFVIPTIIFKELKVSGWPMDEMRRTGQYTDDIKYLFDTKYSAFKLTNRSVSLRHGGSGKRT